MNRWMIAIPSAEGRLPEKVPFQGGDWTQLSCGLLQAWFRRDGGFVKDQLFAANDKGLAVCDGVILNLSELKGAYGAEDFTQVLRRSWEETNGTFFKRFVGPFCGAVYDRESDTLTAYANQTGETFVFYYSSRGFHLVSNDLNMIESVLKENGIPRTLDETAARYLLSFGYMVDERTLFQEIKRVLPGEMVCFSGAGGRKRSYYHHFSFEPQEISFSDAIEAVDQSFRKAVRRCFEKDREYGIKTHLADLSGGLDSRMTSWVARDMGYGPFIFLNYCQSGSLEQEFAAKAANAIGGQFIHKYLDDASFIFDIDHLVDMDHGLAMYCAITGGEQLLRILDCPRSGLEHTGMLGDVIVGSYSKGTETLPGGQHLLKYSRSIPSESPLEDLKQYGSFEEFALYKRGFLGMTASYLLRRHYTCAVSPFMDPDFFALCMSIPLGYRKRHKLYWAWIGQKYPEAKVLPSTRVRKGQAEWFRAHIREHRWKAGMALWKAGLCKKRPRPDPGNMNPFEEWYQTKPDLRSFIEDYYRDTRGLLDRYPETAGNVDRLYASTIMDKMLALTLLAAMKRYFPPEP